MRMEIREQNKIVELWLTREERDDSAFRESLKPIYQQYKDQNYLVAVFLSGEEDLYQQTRDLLLYNRRRLAEKEVQAANRLPDFSRFPLQFRKSSYTMLSEIRTMDKTLLLEGGTYGETAKSRGRDPAL